ncbi:MAG: adenylate/guanylate cyclase domain-containing protein [Proteobacteria bacterium]|nr:adenylate/guanylate cyclase domain-containing protein [Pseudomonadota bacterium]
MATGNFLIYATIGGQSSMISRFGLEEEEKALAYAKQIFEEGKASAVRVTVEVADAQTGRKTTNTVVVHRREDKPKAVDSRAASSAGASKSAGGAACGAALEEVDERDAAVGTAAPRAARSRSRSADSGGQARAGGGARPKAGAGAGAEGQSAVRKTPPSSVLIIKGASAAAGAGVVSVTTYALASALFAATLSHGTLVGGAVLGFVIGYFWFWRMLLTAEEAAQIRAIFSPSRGRGERDALIMPSALAQRRPAEDKGASASEPAPTTTAESEEAGKAEVFTVKPERLLLLQECDEAVIAYLHASLARVIERGRHVTDNRLDPYSTFGCHLFYAGACEGIAREKRLDQSEVRWLLAKSLAKIAFDPDGSSNFAQNYQEYLAQPKYLDMFKAGIDGIQAHLQGQKSDEPALIAALDRWNEAETKSARADFVAVLFTDIIGSTAFTQTHGDQAQMELVEAHNQAVRQALRDNAGREIKHTGDGIMAAFNKAQESVAAAVQIQRAVAQHNQSGRPPELHLRIGVNAGEPIAQGSDLFGSTVQLAARVCGEAGTDEIMVASVVQGLCAGKSFTFESRGQRQLKGFKESVEIFAVAWK